MNLLLRNTYIEELGLARYAYSQGNYRLAFYHLERAHILGQRYFFPHLTTHLWMLRVGIKEAMLGEVVGQIFRIVAVVPGFMFGWVPIGNTGGANVSPVRPMVVPSEFKKLLSNADTTTEITSRVVIWALVAIALLGGQFVKF